MISYLQRFCIFLVFKFLRAINLRITCKDLSKCNIATLELVIYWKMYIYMENARPTFELVKMEKFLCIEIWKFTVCGKKHVISFIDKEARLLDAT